MSVLWHLPCRRAVRAECRGFLLSFPCGCVRCRRVSVSARASAEVAETHSARTMTGKAGSDIRIVSFPRKRPQVAQAISRKNKTGDIMLSVAPGFQVMPQSCCNRNSTALCRNRHAAQRTAQRARGYAHTYVAPESTAREAGRHRGDGRLFKKRRWGNGS